MSKQSEYQLTVAVANYLAHRPGLLWTHFPAGEHRNAVTGAKLKRMGLKRGVPDFLIFNNDSQGVFRGWRMYTSGLAIELKVGNNKPTPEQTHWMKCLEICHWRTAVCHSIDEVVAIVEQCYGK